MIEKKKRATPWKSGKIISIRLRNGVYVLAQMVREPYLVFFNHFKEENSWKGVTLKEENILFCKAVTRQFLRSRPVTIVKDLEPLLDYRLPKEWIYSHMGGHPITVSVKGRERQLAGFGQRLSLVEADRESGQCARVHRLLLPDRSSGTTGLVIWCMFRLRVSSCIPTPRRSGGASRRGWSIHYCSRHGGGR